MLQHIKSFIVISTESDVGNKDSVNADTSKKETDKTKDLQYLIELDLKELKEKFLTLQCELRESLSKVDHEVIVAHILSDYANVFKNAIKGAASLFSDSDIEKLKSAVSVNDVFRVLHNYWSFVECELLFSIVKHYGDYGDGAKVSNYQQELRRFFEKRKVSDMPEELETFDKMHEKVVIKLDKEDPPWSEIKKLEFKICEILQILPSVLLIVGIAQGCVKVTFNIPKHIAKLIFSEPLTSEQCERFKTSSILSITCGEFHATFMVSLVLISEYTIYM